MLFVLAACGQEPDVANSDRIVASPEASASVGPKKTKKPKADIVGTPFRNVITDDRHAGAAKQHARRKTIRCWRKPA